MLHFFDDDVATEVGVNRAIILTHIHYWVNKNAANETNYHDGYYWTYNSIAAYKKLFPFWSEKTIYRSLKDLESDGYIKTGNYNQSPYDRTKWYAITDKGLKLLKSNITQGHAESKENSDFANFEPANRQNDQASVDNMTVEVMTKSPNVKDADEKCHLDSLYKSTIKQNNTKEQQQNIGGPSRQSNDVVVVSQSLCDAELAEVNKAYEAEICVAPPPSHYEMLSEFKDEYGAEYVIQAIKAASFNGARKLSYIKGVLENWKKEGIPKPWEKAKAKKEPQSKYIRRKDGTYKLRGAW